MPRLKTKRFTFVAGKIVAFAHFQLCLNHIFLWFYGTPKSKKKRKTPDHLAKDNTGFRSI